MVNFRKAVTEEFNKCWNIIDSAHKNMIASGCRQWAENYPSCKIIQEDINSGNAYVLTDNNKIVVYGAVWCDVRNEQLQGKWLTNNDNYFVVNRLAVDSEYQYMGYAKTFLEKVESLCDIEEIHSIRIYTSYDNIAMITLLSTLGYCICGKTESAELDTYCAFEKVTKQKPL